MCTYLPSKSALAPKKKLHNNVNFIHESMMARVKAPTPLVIPRNPKKKEEERRSTGWEVSPLKVHGKVKVCLPVTPRRSCGDKPAADWK